VTVTRQLLDGLGVMLAANGVGVWADSYSDDQVGIVVGPRMPQHPSQLIVLTPYGADPTEFDGDTTVRVQVRYRGTSDPNVVNDRADAVYALWQDLAAVSIGGVNVLHVSRVSQTPNGADDNDRTELFQNWAFVVSWPTPHRFD
jgi:hypothetical protein